MEPVTSARKTLVPKSITNRNRILGAKSLYRLSTWTLPVAGRGCPPTAPGPYVVIDWIPNLPSPPGIQFFFPNNPRAGGQHRFRGTKPPPAADHRGPGM